MAWLQVIAHIEDDAMNEAHGKLSWYWDQYDESKKSIKALEENVSSEKVHYHKAETKQSELEAELKNLQKRG